MIHGQNDRFSSKFLPERVSGPEEEEEEEGKGVCGWGGSIERDGGQGSGFLCAKSLQYSF